MYPNGDRAERLVPNYVIDLDNSMREVHHITIMVMCVPSWYFDCLEMEN